MRRSKIKFMFDPFLDVACQQRKFFLESPEYGDEILPKAYASPSYRQSCTLHHKGEEIRVRNDSAISQPGENESNQDRQIGVDKPDSNGSYWSDDRDQQIRLVLRSSRRNNACRHRGRTADDVRCADNGHRDEIQRYGLRKFVSQRMAPVCGVDGNGTPVAGAGT